MEKREVNNECSSCACSLPVVFVEFEVRDRRRDVPAERLFDVMKAKSFYRSISGSDQQLYKEDLCVLGDLQELHGAEYLSTFD